MNLELTVDEINFILQILGELPTKSGAFPLVQKIRSQAPKGEENGNQE